MAQTVVDQAHAGSSLCRGGRRRVFLLHRAHRQVGQHSQGTSPHCRRYYLYHRLVDGRRFGVGWDDVELRDFVVPVRVSIYGTLISDTLAGMSTIHHDLSQSHFIQAAKAASKVGPSPPVSPLKRA